MSRLCPRLKFQEFDDNGDPLVDGKLYSYLAGTTTPAATFTDQSEDTENTNPVILDSAGRADVWLSQEIAYKFVLKDSADVVIWTEDNILVNTSGDLEDALGAIPYTEFALLASQSSANVTGLSFDHADVESATIAYTIKTATKFEKGIKTVHYTSGSWILTDGQISGDYSGIALDVHSTSGQLRYTSGLETGTIKFRSLEVTLA